MELSIEKVEMEIVDSILTLTVCTETLEIMWIIYTESLNSAWKVDSETTYTGTTQSTTEKCRQAIACLLAGIGRCGGLTKEYQVSNIF